MKNFDIIGIAVWKILESTWKTVVWFYEEKTIVVSVNRKLITIATSTFITTSFKMDQITTQNKHTKKVALCLKAAFARKR